MGLGGHHHATSSPLQFFYGGSDPLGQPPPAHMGIPPYQLDPKTAGAIGNHFFILFIFINPCLTFLICILVPLPSKIPRNLMTSLGLICITSAQLIVFKLPDSVHVQPLWRHWAQMKHQDRVLICIFELQSSLCRGSFAYLPVMTLQPHISQLDDVNERG